MTSTAQSLLKIESPWRSTVSNSVVVGKDILELLSSSMYVDPMSVYREYVQNSADAIDEAARLAILKDRKEGKINVSIDDLARSVRVRDNGTGIDAESFEARLTSFGASAKRGTSARGFRGVGRLAGIGYCQELIFRSRTIGSRWVSEMRWDCRNVKNLLRKSDFKGGIGEIVAEVLATRRIDGTGWPEHFFEVELVGVTRSRDDRLLSRAAIHGYLSEIAPVPFDPSFELGSKITAELTNAGVEGSFNIEMTGMGQIYRPHREDFKIRGKEIDSFSDVEILNIPAIDGGPAALGWMLHHHYKGAIPLESRIRGLRLRRGNIQVGDSTILDELFAESRFNLWTVGEVHVLHPLVTPNGRRDDFEQNAHYLNIVNHLAPVARDIAKRCRISSLRRNWIRKFEAKRLVVKDKVAILSHRTIGSALADRTRSAAESALSDLETIAQKELLDQGTKRRFKTIIRQLRLGLDKIETRKNGRNPLSVVTPSKRKTYQEVFSLIFECSKDPGNAKFLVDRILHQLGQG